MSIDSLLAQMHRDGRVLSFLQQLHGGMWQAAVRHGQHDYERGHPASAVEALTRAVQHADEGRVVPWREIWTAGRSAETRPAAVPAAAPVATPAEDLFA